MIEGSIRKAGQRIRVTAQLVNAENGHHVWAERYDRDLADNFDLQDELSRHIAATVAPELEFSQPPVTRAKTPQSLDAWALVQRGYHHVFVPDEDSVMAGRKYFRQAIELDPEYARAYTGLAWSYHRELVIDPSKLAGDAGKRLVDAASRAVSLDDLDSDAHAILGLAWHWTHEIDRAVATGQRAVELNPNNPVAQHVLGAALTFSGRPMEGIRRMERAIVLSPRDPRHGAWGWAMAVAYFTAREYESAVEWSERSIQRLPANTNALLILASSLGHLGRAAEARAALAAYRELMPSAPDEYRLHFRYKNEVDEAHFRDGLRKAGWEG